MSSPVSHNSATVPIEETARYPLPGMAVPGDLAFSPDDQIVTYLNSPERSLERQLYTFDPQSGEHRLLVASPTGATSEEQISIEEALRRERMRQRELGVTRYFWARSSKRILVPSQGDLYGIQVVPGASSQSHYRLVDSGGSPVQDAQFSPDGEWVAYVQDAEIYVIPFEGGEARQVTFGARGSGKTHGLAEYIAQEEMGRFHGFWWSPDSQWIAFVEVDETHIPVYRIVHQGKVFAGEPVQEDHHYPFAGEANARVRLGVIAREGGEPVWMDLGQDDDFYLARVTWLPGGRLTAQLENRLQTELEMAIFDLQTGQRTTLLRETTPVWINLHDLFCGLERPCLGEHGCFLWASERSGFRHLYLYNREGKLLRPLTHGEWMVESLAGVDEEKGLIYFTATMEDARESHLYCVPLDGSEPRRITEGAGTHTVVLDHACRRYIDTHHSICQPPQVVLRSLEDNAVLKEIYTETDPRVETLHLEPPELVSLHNRNGDLLYGAIYRPPDAFGSGPFPTLVDVYGGPHVQVVKNSWALTVDMRAQYLCRQGFLVFMLDNRGSARRGLSFESAIYHHMGSVEVEDQVDGVRWLVDQGLADERRVGIYGWSYGGYMAAMCLGRAEETFAAAVAGAPVTHWDGYDTHYTERYMGAPQANPDGYELSSVMRHIAGLRGHLMIVHGLIDENVHFRHTARLINALIANRKPYDLLVFPDERHMPRSEADRIYMEERIRDFFLRTL